MNCFIDANSYLLNGQQLGLWSTTATNDLYYTGGSVQKLWSAKIINLWINMPVRDENGFILRDERVELERNILLKNI